MPEEKRHGIHTNTALPFHNDMGAEILTLHYRQVAKSGGATSVSSAATIYEELARQHPDVLETLKAPNWPVQLSANPVRFASLPLLAEHDGRVVISVDPGRLGLHPATAGVRPEGTCELDDAQLRALAVLNQAAEKHAVSIAAEAGDVLFINNFALLHKREKYVDFDDATSRRHLVRLWLRNPALGWDLPEAMKAPWKAAYGPVEGFGRFKEDRYEVVPAKEYKVPKYSAGSAAWLIECDEEGCASAAAGAAAVV